MNRSLSISGLTVAAVVEAATVVDTAGNVVDTSEFFGTPGESEAVDEAADETEESAGETEEATEQAADEAAEDSHAESAAEDK